MELSFLAAKVPGNFLSVELSFPGTGTLIQIRVFHNRTLSNLITLSTRELSLRGTFVPWNFRSWERKSESLSSDTNGKNFGSCRRCMVNSSVLMVMQLKILGLPGVCVSWESQGRLHDYWQWYSSDDLTSSELLRSANVYTDFSETHSDVE